MDEGDRVTIEVDSWLAGSPVIEDESGSTPVFTPVTLRFFGVRRLQLTMNSEPEVRREVPVSELPEEVRSAVGDLQAVSEIVDTPVPVTLAEFLEAASDAIWYGCNDRPGCFRIEMHGSRTPPLIVEYERAEVEVAATAEQSSLDESRR